MKASHPKGVWVIKEHGLKEMENAGDGTENTSLCFVPLEVMIYSDKRQFLQTLPGVVTLTL